MSCLQVSNIMLLLHHLRSRLANFFPLYTVYSLLMFTVFRSTACVAGNNIFTGIHLYFLQRQEYCLVQSSSSK